MVAQLSIPVSNVANLIALGFTRLEIWRTDEFENQYEEITASSAEAAWLESSAANAQFRMGGKTLKLKVNGGSEQTITFSSIVDYWTPTQVANRINEVVAGLATVVGSKVKLTAPTTGRVSSVEITSNDADQLGWTAGQKSYGKDARLTLSGATVIYQYSDVAGSSGDHYKWRFSANGANPVSELYGPIEGSDPPIAAIPLSIATAYFVGMDGRAQQTRIIIVQDNIPLRTNGYGVGSEHPMVVESDELGFLQVPLVQGMKIRVAIEGTAYVREITVPATSTFDLLQALSTAPDPFTVQVPPPFLIRRAI